MGGWDKAPEYGGETRWYHIAGAIVGAVLLTAGFVGCSRLASGDEMRTSAKQAGARERGEDPCTAPLPSRAGTEFAGIVRYVIDGDSICVGPRDGDGATWIEVRLMDFDAPESNQAGGAEAEATLRRLALNRPADCVVTRSERSGATRSYDRTHAICVVDGRTIGDAMRAAHAPEGGN